MAKHTHIDLSGQEVHEGSFIAYAAAWGRSAVLKFGVVTRLAEREGNTGYQGETKYTARIITVDRLNVDLNGDGTRGKWKLQNKGNEITASFMDRLVVIQPNQLPPGVQKILEEGVAQWRIRREQDRD